MKLNILAFWCGFATLFSIQIAGTFAYYEFFSSQNYPIVSCFISFFAGILAGCVTKSIVTRPNLSVHVALSVLVCLIWSVLFPAPPWRSLLVWYWPFWGFASFVAVLTLCKLKSNNTEA